ncbi:MAG: hypothetical protein M1820_010008 [Bogoriella megaspora]|nr:MAG: hypothetical protein M1820_010008 [Bogoriella megaspora]
MNRSLPTYYSKDEASETDDGASTVPKIQRHRNEPHLPGSVGTHTDQNAIFNALEPPTVFHEVNLEQNHVSTSAHLSYMDSKKSGDLQTGETDSIEDQLHQDVGGPSFPRASKPSEANYDSECDDDWMSIASDTNYDETYNPNKHRKRPDPGLIKQKFDSLKASTSSACERLRTVEAASAACNLVGNAIKDNLPRPLIPSSYGSSGPPPNVPPAVNSPTLTQQYQTPPLQQRKDVVDPSSIFPPTHAPLSHRDAERQRIARKVAARAAVERIKERRQMALVAARRNARGLEAATLRAARSEAPSPEVKHPRDAPEGSNLEGLAIVSERVGELPRAEMFDGHEWEDEEEGEEEVEEHREEGLEGLENEKGKGVIRQETA